MVNPPVRRGISARLQISFGFSGNIAGSDADAGLTGRHPAPCRWWNIAHTKTCPSLNCTLLSWVSNFRGAVHLRKGFFMGKYHELYIGYFYCLSILVTRYRTVQYLNLYVMCWIHKIASRRPFYLLTLASLLIAIWFIQQPFFRVISIIRGIRSWGCFLYGYAAAPVRCCCTWCEIHKGVSRCESRMLCMWRSRRKWAYRGLWAIWRVNAIWCSMSI